MIRIRQNLTKTWKSQIEAATTQITVLSPYITPNDTCRIRKVCWPDAYLRTNTTYNPETKKPRRP